MSYICPVCNGLTIIEAVCQHCQHQLVDYGRIEEYYGPYSPYREIDDAKMTNGILDYQNHICIHLANCPICNKNYIIEVKEQLIP